MKRFHRLALPLLTAGGMLFSVPVLANPGIAVPFEASQRHNAGLPGAAQSGFEQGSTTGSDTLPIATFAMPDANDADDGDQLPTPAWFGTFIWVVAILSTLFMLGMWLLLMRGMRYSR